MTTMNLSLPEPLQEFVEEQARIGGYGTASEYVQSLIREAQLRAARQELDAKLLDGFLLGYCLDFHQWRRNLAAPDPPGKAITS